MAKKYSNNEVLSEVYALLDDWISDALAGKDPVIRYKEPQQLKAELDLDILETGGGEASILNGVKDYLKYAVRTAHPAYLNQLFGGFNLPAFIGEVVTAATNTSMYTYEVAPVATLMEMRIVDKMLSYTGWQSGTGSMMTGGSNTNMVAMLLARNAIFSGSKMEGISGLPKLAVFVSERSHFSMLKAANTIGIGQNGVIKVPIDALGRMRAEGLELAMKTAIAKGSMPFMVCSTAGTTETGSFDAIDEVSAFAKKHALWHHVDGSWGGSLIISEKRRTLFKGLELADSFSWNPHKLMNIPLVCSVLLVRDPKVMREEIQSYDADYIYHDNDSSAYDLGPASLQCGRRVDALKLWLAWRYYGDKGYAQRMEHLWELSQYATSLVEDDDKLELMFPTQSLNVNFRYQTPEGVDADRFNEELRYRLIREGEAMVNYCRLNNGLSIRLILLNPDLQFEDILAFFNSFRKMAEKMLSERRVLH
jgi:sulfinoalanine decarboxylase